MNMKRTVVALFLACVFAAPALMAQTADTTPTVPSGATRAAHMVQRVSYLTTVLSLTSVQQTQVTSILTSATTNRSAVRASMKTAHTNLQNAIHSNDAAAMEQASNSIATLIAQQMLARAKTEAAIYQVLTPEQQTKMSQLESEGHSGRHGFGRGV
jgi:Spy/CpxP family protein refolding chaperone